VLNLIRSGVRNVIAMNGTKLPESIKALSKDKEITLFVDGDRGGKLIIKNVLDNAKIDSIVVAPDGKEVEELTKILNDPKKPFVAIVGGAKIETKLPLVEHLAKIADFVLVGGELPVEIKERKMTFAQNVMVASLTSDAKDISEESIKQFTDVIASAKTVVWNGPQGLFEEGHNRGSREIAESIINSGAYTVVGGGETVEFLAKNNLLSRFSFVSSGGGAMLEFLSGKTLSALKALE